MLFCHLAEHFYAKDLSIQTKMCIHPITDRRYAIHALLRDKLHWAFQLYDRDGSGAIDIQEMIKVLYLLISSEMSKSITKQEHKVS